MPDVEHPLSPGVFIKLTLLAWLAMLSFDFFLHAGLLAPIYLSESPFLLPAEQAFTLIPIGYLSFLILAGLLVWLSHRLHLQGWRQGGLFGLQLGALVWGAFSLGLLSISTVPRDLLAGWFLGQTLELGLGGVVIGSGLATSKHRKLFAGVLLFALGIVVVTILLQSLGFAPAF